MKAPSDQTAGGWAGDFDVAHTWAQFDEMPRGVRRLYSDAPYNYTAIDAWRAWRRGADMRRWVQDRKAQHAADVQREALRLYGPLHPQAEV